jgi:hypothetical protein
MAIQTLQHSCCFNPSEEIQFQDLYSSNDSLKAQTRQVCTKHLDGQAHHMGWERPHMPGVKGCDTPKLPYGFD